MRRIIFLVLVPIFFFLFSTSPSHAQTCTCKFNTAFLRCEVESPTSCGPGYSPTGCNLGSNPSCNATLCQCVPNATPTPSPTLAPGVPTPTPTTPPAASAGACKCIINASRTCGLTENNCSPGFHPTCNTSPVCAGGICVPGGACNGSTYSCGCEANPPPDPADGCGSTSEPCCFGDPITHAGGTCDTSSLICINTAAGYRCLSLGQCNLLPGGCPVADSNFCDPTTGGIVDPDSPYAQGISTAIGCIPLETKAFVTAMLNWSIGISGGIAFLLVVYSSFLIATASGNPPRLKSGQELLFSALAGIILIVLSVLILNFIGVNVLGLGSLGFNL